MKTLTWDCLIIGGGPAGLYCAIHAARHLKVLVLEKKASPARKLLISGGGKCNLTNVRPVREFFGAYGEPGHGAFLKPALLTHGNVQTIDFFERLGIKTKVVDENGKVFPESARAQEVLDAMLAECARLGVEIRTGQAVKSVQPRAEGGFRVETMDSIFEARRLVVATGGKSLPTTGSEGDGYGFAQALGHGLTGLSPGLTPFNVRDHALAGHSGMSFKNLAVSLWQGDRKVVELAGAMVVTHGGYSGPVIHNLSRYARPGDRLKLAFVSGEENFRVDFLKRIEKEGALPWKLFLKKWPLPQALAQTLLKLAGLDGEEKAARAGKASRLKLLEMLEAFPCEIESLGGFERAMVTCGGVRLEEIDPKTMESRKVPGLYFIGEVLDVDGDTGGYDLQAAWSTAYLAAGSMAPRE